MPGTDVNILQRVMRKLGTALADGQANVGSNKRASIYGEDAILSYVRKSHLLADEGSYFVANNAGAGVATAAAPTAFSDTAPLFTIFNKDGVGGKRIYLDTLALMVTAAGTAGITLQLQIKLDNANRYASGGTNLVPTSPNMDLAPTSIADVRFLPVATAASVNARTVVGARLLLSHALAIGDEGIANFGGVEGASFLGLTTLAKGLAALPPIIIGPGQCVLIDFLISTQSAASSWSPELAWWER